MVVSAKLESDLVDLEEAEAVEYLETLGLEDSGASLLIRSVYRLLGLRTYLTTGEQESRAWTIREGMLAPQAAGVIHTDFEKGFIRAETISYTDYIDNNGENGAKEFGKMRLEGKEYKVADGDVMHFRHAT